jgi:hypothetical protein
MQSPQSTADFSQAFSMMFQSMQQMPNMTKGENGAAMFSSAANSTEDFDGVLSELFLLVRGESSDNITGILERLKNIIDSNKMTNNTTFESNLVKLIKVTLYTREPRSGKGERTIFYHILNWMWDNYLDAGKFIITVLQDFGYWGDFSQLFSLTLSNEMKSFLVELYTTQLITDKKAMLSATPRKISLAGKWAPREQSLHKTFATAITKKMFKNLPFKHAKKAYRLSISTLNAHLKTVEPLMCQKNWMLIQFDKVPSVAMTKLTKAFQDEITSPFPKSSRNALQNSSKNTRYKNQRRHLVSDPDYIDRNECRSNLIAHVASNKKINSKVTNLSEIIDRYLNGAEKDIVWEAQWESRVNEIRELIKTTNITPTIFPMIDLSASMNGSPKINAITLGLFCATMLDKPFGNMFLTFDTKPQLGMLQEEGGLYEKIQGIKEWLSKWGGSTNIQAAFDLLLDIAVTGNVPQDKMPKVLAVFSDMQFDTGDSTWNETTYETVKRRYENSSYSIPHIIFWNLRANTPGFQVKASTPDVTMLGGYSTRMMDLFLTGSKEE